MNRTRKRRRRRYTRRRRRRGGFKFKRPKFKTPKFKMPKMNITKKLGKMKDMGKKAVSSVGKIGKKGLGAVGKIGKKGLGAVGKVGKMGMGALGKAGKMGMGALKTPLGMAAGLGGLGSLAYLASSMGGFPMEKLKYFAKFGGMAIAPLLLLGSFIKPGAKVVYHGLKKIVATVVTGGKGGVSFLINLVGIPIKGLMTIIGNLPTLMLAMGGFAGIAALAGKNYLKWIYQSWRYIVDGWSSSPLLTWCEKKPDGTCRCPQILKIKKENGKPVVVIEKAKKGWFSSSEGKSCFMNRQCPSGFICKKTSKWNPRGKCSQTSIPDVTQNEALAAVGKSCFMNRQCPSGFICKKTSKWNPRGKCAMTSIPDVMPSEPIVSAAEQVVATPEPVVTPAEPIVEPTKPLVSNKPITLAGGGKIKFNMTIEARSTKKGIKWKVKKSRGRTRKEGGNGNKAKKSTAKKREHTAKKSTAKKREHTAKKANRPPTPKPAVSRRVLQLRRTAGPDDGAWAAHTGRQQ